MNVIPSTGRHAAPAPGRHAKPTRAEIIARRLARQSAARRKLTAHALSLREAQREAAGFGIHFS